MFSIAATLRLNQNDLRVLLEIFMANFINNVIPLLAFGFVVAFLFLKIISFFFDEDSITIIKETPNKPKKTFVPKEDEQDREIAFLKIREIYNTAPFRVYKPDNFSEESFINDENQISFAKSHPNKPCFEEKIISFLSIEEERDLKETWEKRLKREAENETHYKNKIQINSILNHKS